MTRRLLRALISHLIPTGLALPVIRGPLRGRKWIAGAAAGAGKGLSVIVNQSEPEQLRLAMDLFPANGIAFDIGANVGLYSLLLSAKADKVVAFEPYARNIRYLVRTLAINDVHNVVIVPCAVADSPGMQAFDPGQNCAMGHLCGSGGQVVACITCDDFSKQFGLVPDLIKIDVEGAEELVLRGARELLSRRRPAILLSFHSDDIKASCTQYLRQLGYDNVAPINGPTIEAASELAYT